MMSSADMKTEPFANMRPTVASTDREPNRWAVLALLSVAQLMVVLDATIVTIAIPSAQEALHFSTESRQWIVTAYALAFGSLLLLGGKLGDLFGRKWTLIAGLVGFSIASAIGGLAQSFGVLVAARTLQGAFGALLAPSALGLLTVTFEGSPDRPKAFGIFGAIAGGGASLGLILGGALTQVLSWRWCLYVNLVIAVPTTIVALRLWSITALRSGIRSTYRGFSPQRWACSRWSMGSPTPRLTPGPRRERSWRSSPAPCS
jgi:MFS family permease